MQKLLKHISAFALALLVLFSTFSFTINEHFCGGINVSTTVGVAAKTCGMELEIHDTDTPTVEKASCCADVSTLIQGQDELSTTQDITITTHTFIKAFVYSYIFILPQEDQEKAIYKPYSPPPLVRDIQLLDETFLI